MKLHLLNQPIWNLFNCILTKYEKLGYVFCEAAFLLIISIMQGNLFNYYYAFNDCGGRFAKLCMHVPLLKTKKMMQLSK